MDLLGRTFIAGLIAAVLLGLATTSAEANHTKGKCRGGKTLAQNSVARLYENRAGTSIFGCAWSRNERVHLDREYDDGYVYSEDYLNPRLGGRFAAWTHVYTDMSCKAACPEGYQSTQYRVERVDLRTEASTSHAGRPAGKTLRINKRGALAWLQGLGDDRREVHAWDADGHRVLDTGVIPASSFKLSGSTLRWTADGTPRSATLR
jgi:hypothetical protein